MCKKAKSKPKKGNKKFRIVQKFAVWNYGATRLLRYDYKYVYVWAKDKFRAFEKIKEYIDLHTIERIEQCS